MILQWKILAISSVATYHLWFMTTLLHLATNCYGHQWASWTTSSRLCGASSTGKSRMPINLQHWFLTMSGRGRGGGEPFWACKSNGGPRNDLCSSRHNVKQYSCSWSCPHTYSISMPAFCVWLLCWWLVYCQTIPSCWYKNTIHCLLCVCLSCIASWLWRKPM